MIPTKQQNPNGLHQRYAITKASGEPCDPSAVYFVLRLDSGGSDPAHIEACRFAAAEYADGILGDENARHLWPVADQLNALIADLRDADESEAYHA